MRIPLVRRTLWRTRSPILGVSLICREMYGNGVRIGMEHIPQVRLLIRWGRLRGRNEFSAVEDGSAPPASVVQRTGIWENRTIVSQIWAFVLSEAPGEVYEFSVPLERRRIWYLTGEIA